MSKKKSFLVYFDWEAPFDCLNDTELGELFRAMLKYAKNEEEPEFDNQSLCLVFSFVKNAIDRDKAAYEERCKKNAENGKKGGKKTAENVNPDLDFSSLLETIGR